jgi:hypothetical protein
LEVFEIILNECNEGITMFNIKTRAFGRVAAAAALSFGLAASAVSVASASSQGHHSSRHDSGALTSPQSNRVEGTVSAYTAAAGTTNGSITVLSEHGTSTVYVTTPATTITGLAAGATLVSPDRVKLELSTTTPVTVTSIKVDNHGSKCVGSKGNEGSNSRGFSNGGSSKNGNFRK